MTWDFDRRFRRRRRRVRRIVKCRSNPFTGTTICKEIVVRRCCDDL